MAAVAALVVSQAAERALRLQPDLLVLDIGMPGLNGYEVAGRVRAPPRGARSLMIAATGWEQDDDRQKAVATDFDMDRTKPFDSARRCVLIANRDD